MPTREHFQVLTLDIFLVQETIHIQDITQVQEVILRLVELQQTAVIQDLELFIILVQETTHILDVIQVQEPISEVHHQLVKDMQEPILDIMLVQGLIPALVIQMEPHIHRITVPLHIVRVLDILPVCILVLIQEHTHRHMSGQLFLQQKTRYLH